MRDALRNVGRVLVAIVLGMVVCWLIGGCSPRIVEVEKPVIVENTHTQHHTDIVRDTLVWRDSIYHFIKGDTVVIEKWHTVQQVNKWVVTDTIRDTIPKVVTVTETRIQEVNKLHWWQKVLCWLGGIALVLGGLFAAWKLGKK